MYMTCRINAHTCAYMHVYMDVDLLQIPAAFILSDAKTVPRNMVGLSQEGSEGMEWVRRFLQLLRSACSCMQRTKIT